MAEARLRNESGEIIDNNINHTKVVYCPSSTSSFPEDCARLKLSSARASQAGLREMMMQTKNERVSGQWSKKTTCTTRIPKSYVWGGEIADSACPGEMWYYFYIRA